MPSNLLPFPGRLQSNNNCVLLERWICAELGTIKHEVEHSIFGAQNSLKIGVAAGPDNHMGEQLAGTHAAPTLSSNIIELSLWVTKYDLIIRML